MPDSQHSPHSQHSPYPQESLFPIIGFYKINFVLYLLCVSWVIILLITPALEKEGTISFGEDGMVGYSEHYSDIQNFQNPFVRTVYDSGDSMCHQNQSRSLVIFGNQMSYCARCFGIFFGLALGAAISTFIWIDLKWWLLPLGIIPIGLDGGLQLLTSYVSNNVLRIFTGTLIGMVTMLIVGLVAIEISESFKLKIAVTKQLKSQSKNIP